MRSAASCPTVAAVDEDRGALHGHQLRDPLAPLEELGDMLQPVGVAHVGEPPLIILHWVRTQLSEAEVALADGVDVHSMPRKRISQFSYDPRSYPAALNTVFA
eukprot:CAMPEP_0177729928 /NCGR_PEP_ID=MMETSP0484_2-20121128/21707_1 /TAXON_ID=354590 /ORGANISM="Rhodomonas lens, Strain RHODO" /LENGTH=102 /DNA_ID=CAMNT_0019242863 /DNA_START=569 /DNA_END=878 /DNA_ORIENTATION=+